MMNDMPMDKYRIDSHKLMYHVPRVNQWLNGDNIYPIYMEISPSGSCNHRCTFCALDFMEYQKRYLDTNLLRERLSEMGRLGLKSIMYAGEGEPFLHKKMADIIHHTKESGIDVALTTNGVLLNKPLSSKILSEVEWIKVSVNAGTRDTYAKVHRTKASDFERVLENMSYAAVLKKNHKYTCTLGFQLLLLPENRDEVLLLAEIARDIGMDYLVIKPYSHNHLSKTNRYKHITYENDLGLYDSLQRFNNEHFRVIFRARTMKKWDEGNRSYRQCLALPFWSYIDAGGMVWGCSAHLGDKRFYYGNIYEKPFQKVWESEERKGSIEMMKRTLDVSSCRINCRMDNINKYLWELKYPPEHVNFI